MNLYAYVGNDPLNSTDPTGLAGEDCTGSRTGAGCDFVKGSEARNAIFNRAEALREAGMDDPSQPLADAAASFADGMSVAGDVIEEGYTATAGGGLFGALSKLIKFGRAAEWTLGSGKSATKWANQMAKRGWNEKQFGEALRSKGIAARNAVNPGNPATRHVHPETGQSIVIDNKTN
jgi:hypothetical protein